MTTLYKHTQIGYLLIIILGSALALLIALLIYTGFPWVSGVVAIFLAGCVYVFSSLTIIVTNTTIECHFGAHFMQKRLALTDICAFRIVTNPWYYGWGIHLIPGGWLYNVSGFDAVELTLKNGRKFRLGTNDAEQLSAMLRSVLA